MDGIKTIFRTPDLMKVMVASGLAQCATSGTDLVLPIVAGEHWGEKMAEMGSLVIAARFAVQLVATPFFGRWSDRVPRKWAFLVMGIAAWAPLWPFLIMGTSLKALWAAAGIRVVAGAFGSTAVGYALVHDLTKPEERAAVVSIGFAGMMVVVWVPRICIAIVQQTYKDHLVAPVYCDLCTLAIFILLTAWIRSPPPAAANSCDGYTCGEGKKGKMERVFSGDTSTTAASTTRAEVDLEDYDLPVDRVDTGSAYTRSGGSVGTPHEDPTPAQDVGIPEFSAASPPALKAASEGALAATAAAAATPVRGASPARKTRVRFEDEVSHDRPETYTSGASVRPVEQAVNPMRGSLSMRDRVQEEPAWKDQSMLDVLRDIVGLLKNYPILFQVIVVYTMVSLPEVAEGEVMQQFAYEAFGIWTANPLNSMQNIVFAMQYSTMVSAAIWCGLVHAIAKRVGLLNFIRSSIPVVAVVQLAPMILLVSPTILNLILIGSCVTTALSVGVAMNILVMLEAPHERIGEALCVVSLAKAVSALFGSLVVPPINSMAGPKHLWVFFVIGAISTLLSWPVTCMMRLKPGTEEAVENAAMDSQSSGEEDSSSGISSDDYNV